MVSPAPPPYDSEDFSAEDMKLGVMCGMSLAAAAPPPAPQRDPRVRPQLHFLCGDGGNGCLVGMHTF
jgi:hypothetical protein